ncbi:MAG: hypothetical protein ACTHOH_17340 [Lysobacteraceae bacterium]
MQQLNPTAQAIERVIELTCCYEAWWSLVDRDNRDAYSPVFDRYGQFFSTTIHSLLLSFTVIAYQLFETRKDTVSINSLLSSLDVSHEKLVTYIKSEIDRQKPITAKVFALRSKVYAHRSKDVTPEEVFKNVGITPNELRSVLVLAQKCVALIAGAVGERAEQDLLKELKSQSLWMHEDLGSLMKTLNTDHH